MNYLVSLSQPAHNTVRPSVHPCWSLKKITWGGRYRVNTAGVDLDVINRYRWPTLVRYWDRYVRIGRSVMTPGPTRNPRACPRRGRVNETSRGCWPRTKHTHGSGFRSRLSVLAEHLIFGAQLSLGSCWVHQPCVPPARHEGVQCRDLSFVGCSSFPSVPLQCGMVGVSPARPYVEFFVFVFMFLSAPEASRCSSSTGCKSAKAEGWDRRGWWRLSQSRRRRA